MTEFRTIMPISATVPSIATKPIGFCVTNSARTTPMTPSGATLQTRKRRLKLCIWIIRTVSISTTTMGKTARTEFCPFALSSTLPPSTIL
jgi:hypothetical protein